MKMQIVACDLGNKCVLIRPCQHNCIITFANGTTTRESLNAWDLVTDYYWKVLNNDDKSHFQKMQRRVQAKEDKSKYALFLQHKFIN